MRQVVTYLPHLMLQIVKARKGTSMSKDWQLTIGDILKRPLFEQAEVVAGSRGLARPIRWVHVLETEENASFLNGGELILSTGVGFGQNTAKRLSFLNAIIKRNAVGLCVELGPYIPEIPSDMRELANHHEFPLVAFHQPVRFVDITLDLHENLVNRQAHALRELEHYARDLQKLTLQTQSLPRILSHFQAAVQAQTFFLSLNDPPLFAPNLPHSVQEELTELLNSHLLALDPLPEVSGFLPISDHKHFLYQPVIAMGQVLAYLGFIAYENTPNEILSLILDYTGTAMAQLLLRRMFALERSLDNENRLLEDILHERPGTGEQLRSLLGLYIRQGRTPRFWAVILEAQQERTRFAEEVDSPFHDRLAVFRFLLTKHGFRPLIKSRGNRLYLLLVDTKVTAGKARLQKALAEIERSAKQALGEEAQLRLGVSNPSQDYARGSHAFKEAEQVLAFSDFRSPFFADLGVYRLLLQLNRDALDSFIKDYLGPLLDYDQKHGSQLLLTLSTLLEHGLSKQDAADKLFIRRQTLYHRLDKIQELLGDDCLNPQNRLSLELALRAYDWLHRGIGSLG